MTTLRLKCLRCGDPDDMDPLEMGANFGACGRCRDKAPRLTIGKHGRWSNRLRLQWAARWQKNQEWHPTCLALTAALEKMESTPYGTLDTEAVASW